MTVHISLCVALIGMVLVQQGKGADAGATFGGSSNTVLGAGGAADFITKSTTGIAIAFMVTSILLVRAYSSGMVGVRGASTTTADPLAGSVMQAVETQAAEGPAVESGGAATESASEAAAASKPVAKEAAAPVQSDKPAAAVAENAAESSQALEGSEAKEEDSAKKTK